MANKPGGPQDVLSSETVKAKLAAKAQSAAMWKKAYDAKVRAEHGHKFSEEMLVETRPKMQKWQVLVYWSDVLSQNSMSSLKQLDYLKGERAHTFPRDMFKDLKGAWDKQQEDEQNFKLRRMQLDRKAEKEMAAQRKRKAADEKRKRDKDRTFDANAEEEEVDYEGESDGGHDGHDQESTLDEESDAEPDKHDFKRRSKRKDDSRDSDEERRRSRTVADEPRIGKPNLRDPKAVQRNKENDAKPKPTEEQREAAKKRRKKEEMAEVSKKAALLKKEEAKQKEQQERKAGQCHLCKKIGHKAKDCPNPICRNCGEPGHHAERCPEAICDGCKAWGMDEEACKGHLYKVCPFVQNEYCTFCRQTGHKSDNCPKPGCKNTARVAAKSAPKAAPGYDPNQPDAGFERPAGAQVGLEDYLLEGEEVTDEMFKQQCEAEHQCVFLIESRKLEMEHVRESARKEAAEKYAAKSANASPKPRKAKSIPASGSTTKKIDFVDDKAHSEADDDKSDAKGSATTSIPNLADCESQCIR